MKKIVLLSFALSASMMVLASSAKSPQENVVPMSLDNRVEMAELQTSHSLIGATVEQKAATIDRSLISTKLNIKEAAAGTMSYDRPAGAYYWGMFRDWRSLNGSNLLSVPYTTVVWPNLSTDASATFLWQYEDPTDFSETSKVLESTVKHLPVEYTYSRVLCPTLTTKVGATESTYQNPAILKSGGIASFKEGENNLKVGVSSKNFNAGHTTYYATDPGDWWFGTGPSGIANKFIGMATYMEEPSRPYLLNSMYALASNFVADADAEFHITIREIKTDGNPGEIIATATCLAGDAVVIQTGATGESLVTLPFVFVKEDETGLTEEITPMIETAIMVEFTGYQDPKVKSMALRVAKDETPDFWAEAGYMLVKTDTGFGYLPLSGMFADFYSAPSLFLDVEYAWFESDEDTFKAPNEGGSKTFDVKAYYFSGGWEAEEEEAGTLPTWIQIAKTGDEANPDQTLTFTVDALPSDVEGRSFDVTMSTPGAKKVYKISQGVSGVNDAVVNSIKVANVGGDFAVTYPATVNAVKIFNIAGQLVKDIALTDAGSTVIPAQELAKGIYIMQFNDNQKIKVIK